MKLNYFINLFNWFKSTFFHFPIEIILMIINSWLIIYLIENDADENFIIVKLLMVSFLSVIYLLNSSILSEKYKHNSIKQYWIKLWVIIPIIIYFLTLPEFEYQLYTNDWTQFIILCCIWVFLLFFINFIDNSNEKEFCKFNSSLFFRLALSFIYFMILYWWLAILLVTLDYLFGVNIDWEVYWQLFAFIICCPAFIFFLNWINKSYRNYDNFEFNKWTKFFVEYILLILILLYAIIISAYWIKILINWTWPEWWVAWLIVWYWIIGIFATIIVRPLKDNQKRISIFEKIFFGSITLFSILYFQAFYERINEYWFTFNRYLGILLGMFFCISGLYFLIIRKNKIKFIPILIVILAIVSIFPKINWFTISLNSQKQIVENIMYKHWILVNWEIQVVNKQIDWDEYDKLRDGIIYITSNFWAEKIHEYIPEELEEEYQKELKKRNRYYSPLTNELFEYIWLTDKRIEVKNDYFNYHFSENYKKIDIKNYDKLYYIDFVWYKNWDEKKDKYYFVEELNKLIIEDKIFIELDKIIKQISESDSNGFSDDKEWIISWDNYKLYIQLINWNNKDWENKITQFKWIVISK